MSEAPVVEKREEVDERERQSYLDRLEALREEGNETINIAPLSEAELAAAATPLGDKLHEDWKVVYFDTLRRNGEPLDKPRPKPAGSAEELKNDENFQHILKQYPDGKKEINGKDVIVWEKNDDGSYTVNIAAFTNQELPKKNKAASDDAANAYVEMVNNKLKELNGKIANPSQFVEEISDEIHVWWMLDRLYNFDKIFTEDKSPLANDLRDMIARYTKDSKSVKPRALADAIEGYVSGYMQVNPVRESIDDKYATAVDAIKKQHRDYARLSEQEKNKDRANAILAIECIAKFQQKKSIDTPMPELATVRE